VSSLLCAMLFLRPAIDVMLGVETPNEPREGARLDRDLEANDERESYLRARLARGSGGELVATPFDKQDSAMLSTLTAADCLIVRPPHAPPAKAGERVEIIRL
ncbi:MAG: molybdopterin molybdenumtransferase MoeA, partial [Proteobacteria bacterium]|nr:molybdopterin molybdenumtransferase MoeA [Pseudomonadota bacterium]